MLCRFQRSVGHSCAAKQISKSLRLFMIRYRIRGSTMTVGQNGKFKTSRGSFHSIKYKNGKVYTLTKSCTSSSSYTRHCFRLYTVCSTHWKSLNSPYCRRRPRRTACQSWTKTRKQAYSSCRHCHHRVIVRMQETFEPMY